MPDAPYIQRFLRLRQRWRGYALLCRLLAALTMAVVCTSLVYMVHGSLWWSLPLTLGCLLALLLPVRSWWVSTADVLRYFNISYPQLEESSGLLLQPYEQLTFLQQLQVQKIAPVLDAIPDPQPFKKQLRICVLVFLLALVVSVAAGWWVSNAAKRNAPAQGQQHTTAAVAGKALPPQIAGVNISIQPPAYTRLPKRRQQQLNLEVPEGALLQWELHTTQPVSSLQLVLNDTAWLNLHPANSSHTAWQGRATAARSGFYQLRLNNTLSDLYKIAVVKDLPPVIGILTPGAYTVIDYGMPTRIHLRVNVADDYGITGARIQATLASGSGEAVKFKEQPITFNTGFSGNRTQYILERTVDLAALGMQPGSELYFYVQAQDNRGQEARSAVYMVVLPDTAQLMRIEGMANSVNLKPEYFRSQRQIIIETEQLIHARDTLSVSTLKNRSNALGMDQGLLRLRYGKFLGEENEANIGDDRVVEEEHHDHNQENAVSTAKDFNNAEKIIDQFSHKHDIAEDASFFDAATKNQLKATLTEMWHAERELRTFNPQAALPYEYKALRLLKDLQQQSRAYVAKTSVKTTPLKPEKRLTGELDKIIVPVIQQDAAAARDNQAAYALAILEKLKAGDTRIDVVSLQILQQASRQLAGQATASPTRYLPALQAMRQILSALQQQQPAAPAQVSTAQQALYNLLPPPVQLPQAARAVDNGNLSQQYFMNLNQPLKE